MINNIKCDGFTYLTVLLIIMIVGVMLGAIGQSWKTIMQREREEELLFRGMQYKEAIANWYKPRPGQHVATPLRDLKDLLQDPRTLSTTRYLRRLYTDPITGKEWNVIADPVQGISGVASTSSEKPMKTSGFPDSLADLAGKSAYSDWQFVYKKPGTVPATPAPIGTPAPVGTPAPPVTPAPPTSGGSAAIKSDVVQ